jgi:hypothetical protein
LEKINESGEKLTEKGRFKETQRRALGGEREKVCLDEKERDEKVINLKGEAKIFVSDLKRIQE